jgi:1-acyl-sn-glycerol-3-phosphate acyltransferase
VRVPVLPACMPSRGNAFSSVFSRAVLGLMRWNIEGDFPDEPKQVAIVAPHTSNWDFIVGILAVFAIGIRVRFLAKDTLFRGPLGWFMRWCGGMPVNREAPQGLVPQVVDAIEKSERIFLAITPAGTRSSTKPWKSGFYHIAVAARVPILPVIFDGPNRAIRFLPAFEPSGDYEADLPKLLAIYAGVRGIKP